jgi:hypothetical protein
MSNLKIRNFENMTPNQQVKYFKKFMYANKKCMSSLDKAMTNPLSPDVIIEIRASYQYLEFITGEKKLWEIAEFLQWLEDLQENYKI